MSQLFDYIETLTGHRCTERQLEEIREIVVGMHKPDGWLCPVLPKHIPSHFNWVAMDADKKWWAYQQKPITTSNGFYTIEQFDTAVIAISNDVDFDWKETLKEIPR